MALAALIRLPASYPETPPLSVVVMVGLSMTPAVLYARHFNQKMVDHFADAIMAPTVEMVAHCGPRRKIVGQNTPGTTGAGDVQNSTHNIPHSCSAWTACGLGRRQNGCTHLPFTIAQITCATSRIRFMSCASGFRASHCDLNRILSTRLNHNGLESLNWFWFKPRVSVLVKRDIRSIFAGRVSTHLP